MKLVKIFESTYNFELLREKLLSLGGINVKEVYEEDLEKLLTRGKLMKPTRVVVVKMKPNRCHENSACFWGNYTAEHGTDDMKIATGWVLDGETWYQHSWLYQLSTNKIIETTHKRKLYFGFILSDEETEIFYDNNY